ncbi:MAG TPA: hypothetical protein VKP30_22690 [Polyangiaceae bacterium]|nr:hypothetical protein [Polyangiaceae bacterium]
MSLPIASVGRVCLCEWSGPVTVSMVIGLLAELKRLQERENGKVLLVLHLRDNSARSILHQSSTFSDVLPALWACCQEIAVACRAEGALLTHLRRALCGSASIPVTGAIRSLNFFELLDEALDHAKGVFPHDVLEMQRRRLRSGSWPIYEAEERQSAARTSTREG